MPLSDQQFLRYSRHLLMEDIAEQGQETLLNAHVSVSYTHLTLPTICSV